MSQVPNPEINRRKQTTLKDIADVVGVSINAVSSVLNPRKVPARVSPVTRDLSLETARKRDSRRNAVSRRICSKRTCTLGILLEDLTNSFSTAIVDAFDAEANRLGFLCFVGFSNPGFEDRFQQIKRYVDRGMDGMMIVGSPYDHQMEDVIRFATNSALPIIFTNHRTGRFAAPLVGGDHFQGGRLLGEMLAGEGHRRFVQFMRLGEARSPAMEQRIDGLRAALGASGVDPNDLRIVTVADDADLNETVFEQFPGNFSPTVLLLSNDYDAIQLIITLKKAGVSVPDHVAIAGYDIDKNRQGDPIQLMNHPLLAAASTALTTLRQPAAEYGRQAVHLLVDLINDPASPPSEDMLLPLEPVQGKSAGLPPSPEIFENFLQVMLQRNTLAGQSTLS